MGLFSKKECSICGEKIGMLSGMKLKDGDLCKECKKKLSPFFEDGKESTVEDIKKKLEAREENYKQLDNIDFKDIEDAEVKVIETSREEKQTVDGQQVSYDPPHYTYMIGFDIIIKVNHPYIKVMRISIKNGTVQIYNEGRRLQDDYIEGFVKDKLGLQRVQDKAVHYDNLTIHNFVEKAMQLMPDYSYGFKCSMKNYDNIKEYAYYLALCDEIKASLCQ